MKIKKIEKKKRLYLLEVDEESLYITEDTIVRFMLSKDKEISQEQLEEIRQFAQFSYGKNLALYFISFKMRSTKEVADYLRKHEIEEAAIPAILASLKEDAWINDEKLVESYLSSNLLSGDKGPYFVQKKLQEKGLAKSLLTEKMQDVDFSPVAERQAQKLLKRYEDKLPAKALKDKIILQLSQKGFSYADAKTAFDNLVIEEDPEANMDLLYKELDKVYRKYARRYEGYDLKQRISQALARKGFDFSDIQSALRDYDF